MQESVGGMADVAGGIDAHQAVRFFAVALACGVHRRKLRTEALTAFEQHVAPLAVPRTAEAGSATVEFSSFVWVYVDESFRLLTLGFGSARIVRG